MISPGPISCAVVATGALFLASAVGLTPSADLVSALVIYGPMGIMLVWFAWRAEQKFEKVVDRLSYLGHKIDGMTRAMLADVISRESTGQEAKKLAQQMLDRIESQNGRPNDT